MSQFGGVWNHRGQWIVRIYNTLHICSEVIQPRFLEIADCVSAAQGFKKLRLLEVFLPHFHCHSLWELQREKNFLGNVRGHAKVLKTISIRPYDSSAYICDVETRTTTFL